MGSVHVILGPMFSGKTTELLRRMERAAIAGQRVLLVKPSVDTRAGGGCVGTHRGAIHECVVVDALSDVKLSDDVDAVFVDEGQFFNDLRDGVEKLVSARAGVAVHVAMLSSTFAREPFVQMGPTVAVAESVVHLSAVCKLCGKDAPFTRRIVASKETNLIGGAESYIAVCRKCHAVS